MCSIRMDGGKRMVDLADSRTLPQFFVIFMAAAGRKFQSGIVRCPNFFCPSVMLALYAGQGNK